MEGVEGLLWRGTYGFSIPGLHSWLVKTFYSENEESAPSKIHTLSELGFF